MVHNNSVLWGISEWQFRASIELRIGKWHVAERNPCPRGPSQCREDQRAAPPGGSWWYCLTQVSALPWLRYLCLKDQADAGCPPWARGSIIVKCVEPGEYLRFNRQSINALFVVDEDVLFIQSQQWRHVCVTLALLPLSISEWHTRQGTFWD